MSRVETENDPISQESQSRVYSLWREICCCFVERIYQNGKFWVETKGVVDGESGEEKDCTLLYAESKIVTVCSWVNYLDVTGYITLAIPWQVGAVRARR